MRRSFHRRRRLGLTAVVAMLYMVLFSILALGFYATVTTSVRLSKNDLNAAKARLAAESGIQFMRYHLARVSIPPDPDMPANQVLQELYADLAARLHGTWNMGTSQIAISGNTISIPGTPGKMIVVDNNGNNDPKDDIGFTVTITAWEEGIVCKVMGHNGTGSTQNSRGVRLDFTRMPHETSIFDNAVAARGKVVMKKGLVGGVPGISSDRIAKVLSAKITSPAIQMTGGTVGGTLGIVGAPGVDDQDQINNLVYLSGGSVNGSTSISTIKEQHIKVVEPPEFPVVDTSKLEAMAVNEYDSKSKTLLNVRIPAGTGTNNNPVSIEGNSVIQGILFIESPNVVRFAGTSELQGVVVVQNSNTPSANKLQMTGNFSYGNLPDGPEYDSLRTITGLSFLAPTAEMSLTGGADVKLRGNAIIGTFRNTGSAKLQMEQGSLVAMYDAVDSAVFDGNTVRFVSTGALNQPSAGMTYNEKYVPVGGSYQELSQ